MIRDRVILFIHFSKTIDDYLLESIKITRMNAPNTRIFLISDNDSYIERTREFLVIFKKQSMLLNESVLQYYRTHYPDKLYDRSNFWLKSVKRIFALLEFASSNPNLSIIHLESDSFLAILDDEAASFFNSLKQNIYVPIDTQNRVIPSIVYLTNNIDADKYLQNLYSFFAKNKKVVKFFLNDQELFSKLMLDYPEIVPFPSNHPDYLPDPAFIGQYLFGLDPRHSKFILRSGYVRNEIDIRYLEHSIFSTDLNGGPFNLFIEDHAGLRKRVLNIHNHSKERISKIAPNLTSWSNYLISINNKVFVSRVSINSMILFFKHSNFLRRQRRKI